MHRYAWVVGLAIVLSSCTSTSGSTPVATDPRVAEQPAPAAPTPAPPPSPSPPPAPPPDTPPAACALTLATRHVDDARTPVFASTSGVPALYFRADLDVNTDGSSRSYHPDDPRGRTLALNNIANAISDLKDAQGNDIDCSPRSGACFTRYIETFIAARDARWDPAGHPRVATDGMIPWAHDPTLGRRAPCTIREGRHAGFFVSPTAFVVDPSRDACDQSRYLDSLAFNAAVLPRNAAWHAQGQRAKLGDLVVVRRPSDGRIAYAILGDIGPARAIGEGTIALAAALRGTPVGEEATYATVRALALPDVQYLVFPGTDLRGRIAGPPTQAKIDAEAAALFEAWGGASALALCEALPR